MHVIIDHSKNERRIASILADKYSKNVELVPRIVFPNGYMTPDYIIDRVGFNLKTPVGSGKDLLRDQIKKKRKQARNFIFDITNCPLSVEEVIKQVELIYRATNTLFVRVVVIIQNNEIVRVYKRQR